MGDKYRDPVHGFIEVTDLENEIINSAPFQRLRNVKQLAMTYLVFHGAEHTRFGHSIGVMHLVTTISEESPIIQSLTNKIDIQRLYVKPSLYETVSQYLREIYAAIQS